MKKPKLTEIDLDSLTWIIASVQFKAGNRDRPQEVKNHVNRFIDTLLLRTEAEYYCLVYQAVGHKNFRKYYHPDYKSNRGDKPEFIELWASTIMEAYDEAGGVALYTIESDDALGIMNHRYKDKYEITMVSSDKDLKTIPGRHWNVNKKIDEALTVMSVKDATLFWAVQMLTGDWSTDRIIGCAHLEELERKSGVNKGQKYMARKGIGPVAAKKMLSRVKSNRDITKVLHGAYQDEFGEHWYKEFKKASMLVTMLRDFPSDYIFDVDRNVEFKINPTKIVTPESLFDNGANN